MEKKSDLSKMESLLPIPQLGADVNRLIFIHILEDYDRAVSRCVAHSWRSFLDRKWVISDATLARIDFVEPVSPVYRSILSNLHWFSWKSIAPFISQADRVHVYCLSVFEARVLDQKREHDRTCEKAQCEGVIWSAVKRIRERRFQLEFHNYGVGRKRKDRGDDDREWTERQLEIALRKKARIMAKEPFQTRDRVAVILRTVRSVFSKTKGILMEKYVPLAIIKKARDQVYDLEALIAHFENH